MMNHSYNDKRKYNPYSRLKFKNFGIKIWALTMLMLFGLQSISVKSQQYPVKLVPVVIPPYSMRLGDYATSTDNKLQLQVLMTDLMEPQHQTGVKFTLEAGLNAVPFAQSSDFVVGMNPFMLYPGSNITLTNVDLRALFELQNLGGINALQYSQPLSDGVYQFCFQAYDFYTKNNLSAKTCATVFLTQYDPPMLNLPQNAEKVQAVLPYAGGSGIVFQWMPRQIAPNTKYIFTLKELWDTGQSPISGFLSSPALWSEETYAPTLYYGLDKTQLIPGKRYAWQVQAKSGNPVLGANPTDDNGVYKNNGLSEIFYFDYVENCTVPTLLMAKNVGRGRVEISWSLGGQPAGLYNVQYRKKNSNTEWMTQQSYQSPAMLTGLEDLTEYEYRVGSVCGNANGNNSGNAYSYSGIQYFTTDANDVPNNYQCGVMPAVDIANQNPLQTLLGANEVFMAGDFPVTVMSAQGSNGIYSGTGYIVVPYLADTKIKVSFNNIKLNTDKKLVDGIIETTYDPNETAVSYTSAGIGETFGDAGVKDVFVNFPIGGITYSATPPPGKITIIGDAGGGTGNGSQQDLQGGKDYQIKDKDGNIWNVDENGTVTKGGTVAQGGASTDKNTDGVDSNGSATAITAQGIKVEFENAATSKYAFDKPSKALTSDYKEIDGKFIPFKAVENQKEEPFIAKVTLTDTAVKADSLIFKTSKGVAIDSKKIGDNFELTLKGTFSYAKEEVQAVIKQGDKYKVAGVFYLVHISPKTIKLNLVPTSSAIKLEQKKQEIKDIYSKVAIDVDISVKPAFDISPYLEGGKLPTADAFGDLSTYSNAQNNIISDYKSKNNVGLEYYIFVTDKASSTGQAGYMRLNGQFGFVFNQSTRTIAHELGHGALKLEHPFKQFSTVTKGSTTGLLDYANGTDFIYTDWKQINDPAFKLYAFQGQSSGEMYDRLFKDANGKYFDSGKNITVAVCLNKEEVQQANLLPSGSVYAFHLVDSGKMYYAQKENDKYIYKTKSGEAIELTYVNIASTNQNSAFTIYYPSAYKVTAKYYSGKNADIIEECSGGKFSSQQEEDEAYAFWQFLKNCYDSYKTQKEGYVPRCLWDHNLYVPNGPFGYYINDPAFSSGIVDGLIETADGALDIVKFLDCYDVTSFRAWTEECVDTRDKTYKALKQIYLVISNKDKLSEAYEAVKGKLGEYTDETTAVDNQARYNHGKIVFNVASLFIGVGEAKLLINGEKALTLVLKEGLAAYAAIPKTILKLTQKAGREGMAYIALKTGNKGAYLGYKLANAEIKLADVTAQQVFTNIEWATKNGVVLEKIESVKYIDQAGKEQSGVLELVKQEDGKLGVRPLQGAGKTLNISEIKALTGVIPTGNKLTNLRFSNFTKGFDADFITSLGKKYTDDLIKVKNGLDKGGDLTEGIVAAALRKQGYTVTKDIGKYGPNNGFDVVAYKGTLDNPTEIMIIEAKQFKQNKILDEFDDIKTAKGYHEPSGLTINPANPNTGLPTQMSMDWTFEHVRLKLFNKGGEYQKLSNAIRFNKSKVERFVFAIDKSDGAGYFTKLSNEF